jgi:hypothetical protein
MREQRSGDVTYKHFEEKVIRKTKESGDSVAKVYFDSDGDIHIARYKGIILIGSSSSDKILVKWGKGSGTGVSSVYGQRHSAIWC